MSERLMRTYSDVSPEYWATAYDMPPEYWPDACEVCEASRPFEAGRNPGITCDMASLEAQRTQRVDENVEIDMTIGMGEDPGSRRARTARQWIGASWTTVRRET
jgi:hypothetical protein